MIRFWEESKDKQSSKRLAFLCVIAAGILFSGAYLFWQKDYAGTCAIMGSFSTAGISIMAIGKKQENDGLRIQQDK